MQAKSRSPKSVPARPSPATAEDAGAARGAALHLRLWRQLSAAIPAANMLGALLVFVFLAYVVPTPAVGNSDELVRLNQRLNLIAFVGAMPVLIWIGTLWSLRVNAPTRAWVVTGGSPGSVERDLALREPLRLATVDAVLWVAGAIGFAALNAPSSGALALQVGGTVLRACDVRADLSAGRACRAPGRGAGAREGRAFAARGARHLDQNAALVGLRDRRRGAGD